MNNFIFGTVSIISFFSGCEVFCHPPSQAGDAAGCVLLLQMSWKRFYFVLHPFFSNLNWNERVIIIINGPRKCMGCSYLEGFTLQRNENWPVCSWTTESIWFKLCFIFTGCTFLICITKLKLTSLTNFFVILLICTGCMVEASAPPFWKCCFSHLGIAKYFVLVWVGIS